MLNKRPSVPFFARVMATPAASDDAHAAAASTVVHVLTGRADAAYDYVIRFDPSVRDDDDAAPSSFAVASLCLLGVASLQLRDATVTCTKGVDLPVAFVKDMKTRRLTSVRDVATFLQTAHASDSVYVSGGPPPLRSPYAVPFALCVVGRAWTIAPPATTTSADGEEIATVKVIPFTLPQWHAVPRGGDTAPPPLSAQAFLRDTARPFPTLDVKGVAHQLKEMKRLRGARALVMCGAGISVAAGIPDFRTPGTGLYSRLGKYKLPRPEAVFTLDYLRENPAIFYEVCDDMKLWPGCFPPTYVHHFLALLEEHGYLMRCYTQNIDCLEREAALNADKIVEAHGTFATARCIDCKASADVAWVRKVAESRQVPRCAGCGGIVKPEVVFFGEGLPKRFFELWAADVPKAECLLVLGTSLQVYPFAGLHEAVTCPRVLINRDRCGDFTFQGDAAAMHPWLVQDVFLQGDCQASIKELARELGLERELEARYEAGVIASRGKSTAAASPPPARSDL